MPEKSDHIPHGATHCFKLRFKYPLIPRHSALASPHCDFHMASSPLPPKSYAAYLILLDFLLWEL